MLGDAGVSNSDVLYDGADSSNTFSMDYVRSKVSEFQISLNAIDAAAQSMNQILYDGLLDAEGTYNAQAWIDDYYSNLTQLKITAEAVNAGAYLVNKAGGRMPVLSMPTTLGIAPLLLWGGGAAVIATITSLIVWINGKLASAQQFTNRQQQLDAQESPEARAELARQFAEIDAAAEMASASPLSAISNVVKWVAIGAAAYFAYRAFQHHQSKSE